MDPVHLIGNVDDHLIEEYSEHSPCSSDLNRDSGESQVVPRVGAEYQAVIPNLIAESDRLKLIIRAPNSVPLDNQQEILSLGPPIQIMWEKVESTNKILESDNGDGSQAASSSESLVEPKHRYTRREFKAADVKHKGSKTQVVLALPHQSTVKQRNTRLEFSSCALPGSSSASWKDVERDSFVLGLYIFGKDLALVKRFVDSKTMGDILSFYYGKFYRSADHHRWSGGRNQRSRRVIHGQKIFMGWRQQELLSRISSRMTEETKRPLLEVSRAFGDGKISFEDYVFSLKNMVGNEILMQSMGIGQGKKDLTSTAMEPVKTHHAVSARSEMPTGKACSSLTPAEIVKFLTGGFRLSKARSSDLFWEAVWPRLLARGWHSEQPKDHVISRTALVFLVPGVKKFSRRRLAKGKHYFDSTTDVLNKVASEPQLLMLESEAEEDEKKEENGGNPLTIRNPDSSLPNKRHRYLQPRNSQNDHNIRKFTIVDTSMACNAERGKVRELRCLPMETTSVSTILDTYSSESDRKAASVDLGNETEETTTSNSGGNTNDRKARGHGNGLASICAGNEQNNVILHANLFLDNHENLSTASISENQQKKQKAKRGCRKYLSIGSKRQRLCVDVNEESSYCDETNFEQRKRDAPTSPDRFDSTAFQMDIPRPLSPASSMAEDSRFQKELSSEKPASHADFDLNVPATFEMSETVFTDALGNDDNFSAEHSPVQAEASMQNQFLEFSSGEASTDQNLNRRHSKRNRPLTTKALEALAYGYLASPKKRKKDSEAIRRSRHVRPRTVVTSNFRNGTGTDAPYPKNSDEANNFKA